MIAKMCDSCGSFYLPKPVKKLHREGIFSLEIHYFCIGNKEYDLCPECQIKVLKMLNEMKDTAPERENYMVSVPPDSEGF